MITLELPWPPSVNHYFRHWRGRMVISREGRSFRSKVCAILAAAGVRPLEGHLKLAFLAFPPDRRRRDLDNLQKALLDALEKGGAYANDSQIKRIEAEMGEPTLGGKVLVRIKPYYKQRKQYEQVTT